MTLDEDAGVHVDGPGRPVPAAVRHPGHHRGAVPADVPARVRGARSSTSTPAPTRCSGSTCSGSSGTRRCTSSSCPASASSARCCRCSAANRCSATSSSSSPARPSASSAGACGPTTCSPAASARSASRCSRCRTMLIAIPTGVKIVNWTLTMWGGKLHFTTAMLFAIGLIVEFTIGGLSGVTHAVSPSDTQQTDTYYIVAHFHYVLFGGAVFGLFAGFYYWWPKVFGKMLSETLGKWNFWLMVIGMNLTFGPMHILGLQGQPRRMVVYPDKLTRRRASSTSASGTWSPPSARSSWPSASSCSSSTCVTPRARRREGTARSVGRPQPRVDDRRARRRSTTSTPSRTCTRSTSSSTASTKRSTPTPGRAGEGRARPRSCTPSRRPTPTSTSTCRRRRTGRSCWPSPCRSSPTASSSRTWLIRRRWRDPAAGRVYGWALEPSVADDSDYDPPADEAANRRKELASV